VGNGVLWLLVTMVGLPVLIVVAAGISHHRRARLIATTQAGQRVGLAYAPSRPELVDLDF
jgi:hypothetical protein